MEAIQRPQTATAFFASDVAVTGELVAKSGEAVCTAKVNNESAAYSAGIWTGDMSIAERAEVEATSGKAQSDGSETISAGVYLDPEYSDGITEGVIRPGGSGSSGNGGEEKVCSLTVDGSLSATGGEAVGEHAVSAGVRFPEPEYYRAAGFTVGETGARHRPRASAPWETTPKVLACPTMARPPSTASSQPRAAKHL